jgi:quercetin dioxygenase-like cupin family protein
MTMTPGVTKAEDGMEGIRWNVLGQAYVPKQLSEHSFSWHATLPPGTFVPPHIHPTQDEFIYMLSGRFDLLLEGKEAIAEPGDLIRLPQGIPHGLFNRSDADIKCLFWVSPSRRLYDLFWALHNLGPTPDPAEVVAVSAAHEVDFLPPPETE